MRRNAGSLLKIAALLAVLAVLSTVMARSVPMDGVMDAETAARQIQEMRAIAAAHSVAQTAVEPMMELEDAWAIEDARTEAQHPLVTQMRNGEDELGYDAEKQTFYCTLGGANGKGEWPELRLTGGGAEGVRIAWIDDYSYDWCDEAVREGYPYQLIAYTETEYAYFDVVFTGLPIVVLHVAEGTEIGEEYVPGYASVSAAGYEAIHSQMMVHTRGAGKSKPIDKASYRLEFHGESLKGRGSKKAEDVLGLGENSDWLLLANAQDPSGVRNYISWGMWRDWNPDGQAPMLLESALVEVFVQDAYCGLYELMKPVDPAAEIERLGGNVNTDCAVRLVSADNTGEKPSVVPPDTGFTVEYRYGLQGNAERVFQIMENYFRLSELNSPLSDEEYAALAEACMDVPYLMSYYLFMQTNANWDNAFNNLYIWAFKEDGRYVYRIAPWDMDWSFNIPEEWLNTGGGDAINDLLQLPVRLLNMNVQNCREVVWRIWEEKRAGMLADDALYERIKGVEELVNASGAYLRESEKWYGEAQQLNLNDVVSYAMDHMKTIEIDFGAFWPLPQ